MKILDGKKYAENRLKLLKERVDKLPFTPSLAVVLVGDDPASHLYVKLKEKAAKKVGVDMHVYRISSHESAEDITSVITFLREDPDINGIIVQLPLPRGLDTDEIIAFIGPEKDADGFYPENIENFINGDVDALWPVFPKALLALAEESGEDLDGKSAVIIGKSDVFTQAMVAACTRRGLRVTLVPCEKVACMQAVILSADVVFSACGTPQVLTQKYIKPGAIVIDGGISIVDGKTLGDVDAAALCDTDGYLSPVPGGVGPMTIACLLENVVELAQKSTST